MTTTKAFWVCDWGRTKQELAVTAACFCIQLSVRKPCSTDTQPNRGSTGACRLWLSAGMLPASVTLLCPLCPCKLQVSLYPRKLQVQPRSSHTEAEISTTEYDIRFSFCFAAGWGGSQVPLTLPHNGNLHDTLTAARGKCSTLKKHSVSHCTNTAKQTPHILQTTSKAQTVQKLTGMSIAEERAVGKRKKTNRKCHTQKNSA